MTRLGRQDGEALVIDLGNREVRTIDDFWDAVSKPLGLPSWFGRNFNAWNDTLYGGISKVLDDHPLVVVRVLGTGLFDPSNIDGSDLRDLTAASGAARIDVIPR
jgi:hypothetical protein